MESGLKRTQRDYSLAFKLIESAEKSWRRIRAPEKVASLLEGVPFKDGLPVTDSTPAQQPLAA
jgi:putative transposase